MVDIVSWSSAAGSGAPSVSDICWNSQYRRWCHHKLLEHQRYIYKGVTFISDIEPWSSPPEDIPMLFSLFFLIWYLYCVGCLVILSTNLYVNITLFEILFLKFLKTILQVQFYLVR